MWKLGDKDIKECNSYKYLGVTLKSNGSFSEHVDIIKEKAQKAYFSLVSKSREWGGFQLNLPPEYVLIHRVTLGTTGIFCQLRAEGNFRDEALSWFPEITPSHLQKS